jgi:hypothetical protein
VEANHTPGPYIIAHGITEHSASIDIRKILPSVTRDGCKEWVWIASVHGDHSKTSKTGRNEGFPTNQEAEANARLLAAAPDLLEAAQIVLDTYPTETGEPGHDHYVRHSAREKLKAAIAKAEGA